MSLDAHVATCNAWLAVAAADGPAVFTTSLGAEDMVIADIIYTRFPSIEVVTLDTGRLPPQTYDLLARVEAHYRRRVRVFTPDFVAVEQYVRIHGINGFLESVAQRKDCCTARKLGPLKRALAGKSVWVTGLRREQSSARQAVAADGFDLTHHIRKISPLVDWSEGDVWAYIRQRQVPYNPLHDAGYPSIGCAPCTRAVAPGEDTRAGRWWWEFNSHKECGLHAPSQAVSAPVDAQQAEV
jgi:phosphoadenosine phosphosulfate reductase